MENKIKYCPVCKEPTVKELEFPFSGEKHLVHIACACERNEWEEQKRRIKIREHEALVSRNTGICFRQKYMMQYTFENDNGKTPAISFARKYVDEWKKVYAENMGLIFWGGIGTGKTYMAACIANALLNQEKKVLMTDFTTISNISLYDVSEYIRSLESYDLLIIDDLGAERNSEFALQNVYDVINSRYNSGKPLIVTTNLRIQKLSEDTDMEKARIYDRILGMCVPVCVDGESKRKEEARGKKDLFKELFMRISGGEEDE